LTKAKGHCKNNQINQIAMLAPQGMLPKIMRLPKSRSTGAGQGRKFSEFKLLHSRAELATAVAYRAYQIAKGNIKFTKCKARSQSLVHAIILFCASISTPAVLGWNALVQVETSWYDFPSQRRVGSHVVQCRVSSGENHFFVREIPVQVKPNTILQYYGTSPWCSTNYVTAEFVESGGQAVSPLFLKVYLDNHPTEKLQALTGHLMRIAYAQRDSFATGLTDQEWFYVPGMTPFETSWYHPEDIRVVQQFHSRIQTDIPQSVKILSPAYYFQHSSHPFKRGKKIALRGSPTRLLWEFRVVNWTNIQGRSYPAECEFIRYHTIYDRIDKENHMPHLIQKARLVALVEEPNENVAMFLPTTNMDVVDYRSKHQLHGLEVAYRVGDGRWYDEGDDNWQAIVNKHKQDLVRLLRQLESRQDVSSRYFALLCFLLLTPALFLGLRTLLVCVKQHQPQNRKANRNEKNS
jgi:hypothetical protein